MKNTALILLMAAAVAASAQTPAKTTVTAKPATATKAAASSTGVKLPPGVPPVKGAVQTAFSLRYQDIKIGTGAEAEPNKMYKVHYTGWLADGGRKFDSSYDHLTQVLDKDKKPVLGADGKPQMSPQPLTFPQGYGRLIPGWDQGFYGMKIGGKRRLFIPWQLAYGAKGRPILDPKNAQYPGIPPKADLIFDVELLDVTDIQMPANHPGFTGAGTGAGRPATPAQPAAPAASPTTPAPAAPATPASPATPAQPKS